jgi:hypothetical protein
MDWNKYSELVRPQRQTIEPEKPDRLTPSNSEKHKCSSKNNSLAVFRTVFRIDSQLFSVFQIAGEQTDRMRIPRANVERASMACNTRHDLETRNLVERS